MDKCSKKMKKFTSIYILSIFLLLNSRSIQSLEKWDTETYNNNYKMAEIKQSEGDFIETKKILQNCLNIAKHLLDKEKEGKILLKLGIIFWNTGELSESTIRYKDALELATDNNLENIRREAELALEIYNNYDKAKKFRSSGDISNSNSLFEKAIQIARKIGSKEHELKCLRLYSINFWLTSNLKKFNSLNKDALQLAELLNHKKEISYCTNNIGLSFWKLNSFEEALEYYEKALDIAISLKNKKGEAECLNNIGLIFRNIGNYDKSLDYFLKAYEIDKNIAENEFIALDLNNIGNVYWYKGLLSGNQEEIKTSLSYYESAHNLLKETKDKSIEVKILNNIGSVYNQLESYTKALNYFSLAYEKSIEINDKETTGMTLNNLGYVQFNLGNFDKSTEYYEKAINLALEFEGGHILWEAYLRKANSNKRQNEIKEAIENYKKSIAIIENIRSQIKLEEYKSRYFGTDKRIEAYHNLIDLLINKIEKSSENEFKKEAFYFLEKAKARAFLDSLEISQIQISGGIDFKLKNKEKEIIKDISQLYSNLLSAEISKKGALNLQIQLHNLENELESLKREIRLKSPIYANLKYPEIISLEETQEKFLDNETAFYSYIISNENAYAFVVTKNNLKIFSIPKREKLKSIVTKYLRMITDKDNTNFEPGHILFNLLIKPGLTKQIKKIIIVPDDILCYLPFETLITDNSKSSWLIENYAISYINSISSYREIIKRKKSYEEKPKKSFLGFGNPDFELMDNGNNGKIFLKEIFSISNFELNPLKYSQTEIENIGALFDSRNKGIYLSSEASEENLKKLNLSNFNIIHFATHSIVADKRPDRSAIILSLDKDKQEDGFLQVREIYNLKLNADLITLSACQTGLGQYIRGEGIEGLNRAFFYAGASAVLMSLWSVNDQATSQLMERFYTHINSSKTIMDSLRLAKLELVKSNILSHPYYWGGFIVSGDSARKIFPNKHQNYFFVSLILLIIFILTLIIRKFYIKKSHQNKNIRSAVF